MADVNKIKLPDNTTVNIKDSRISGIDSTPTSGSNNIITSGGVYNSLGDYLPLAGGEMEDGAYIRLTEADGQSEYSTSISSTAVEINNEIDGYWTSVDGEFPGFTAKSDVGSATEKTVILYPEGISYKPSQSAPYNTLTFPAKTGTFALTSDIPAIDSSPTSGSSNAVSSGGVYTALGSYLPLSGGTMTGSLAWSSAAALPADTSPARFLVVDSFDSGGATKYSTAASVAERLGVNSRVRYTQFSSTSACTHYLIKINNTNAWRGMFTVKIYDAYHFDVIEISGYNYLNQTGWYTPRARILTSTARDSIAIVFGYTAAQELWFAIPTNNTSSGQARSVSVQGYNGNYIDISSDVVISLVDGVENLPGTVQATQTYYNVLYPTTGVTLSTDQTISGTKTFSSGELIVSSTTSGTPTLTLQRGTSSDGYLDWQIINSSGDLQFYTRASGSDTFRYQMSNVGLTPQGTITDNVSSLVLGSSARIWSAVYSKEYYVGAGGAFVRSSADSNIYFGNSSGPVLVVDGKVVRRNTTASFADSTLGNATYPWGGVFSTDGDFTGDVTVGGDVTVTGDVTASNIPTYYHGTSDPAGTLGVDGDIYLKLSS